MRPIIISENKDAFASRRPGVSETRSTTNKSVANQTTSKLNVKSRLYESKRPVQQQPPPVQQQQRKRKVIVPPVKANESAVLSPKLTVAQRLANIEEVLSKAVEQADMELSTIIAESSFSHEALDEAAEYCDRTESYLTLHKFYDEMLDLSKKLTEKRATLSAFKTNFVDAFHDCTRFLSRNVLPFQEGMVAKKKEIFDSIEKAKEDEIQNLHAETMLLKTPVEMRDAEVQVLPESFVTYSPSAGILRSSAAQKVIMPSSPLLRTVNKLCTPAKIQQPVYVVSEASQEMSFAAVGNDETMRINLYNSVGRNQTHKSPGIRRVNFDESTLTTYSVLHTPGPTRIDESPITRSKETMLRGGTLSESGRKLKQSVIMPKEPILRTDLRNYAN